MENLHLVASAKTPEVLFDSESGVLLLKGRSIPENSIEFYKPLNDWIDEYAANPKEQTTVDIKLEYFIKIGKTYLTINLIQNLNLRLNSSDIFAVENILMPYNSKKLAFQLLLRTNAENIRNFNNHLAFQQAVMYSSILETRNLIKEQFYNYLNLFK